MASDSSQIAHVIKCMKLDSELHKTHKNTILNRLINDNINLAPQGSDEWLALREYNIGGSEMATITGDSGFSSIDKLIAQKIGLYKFNGNIMTRWGNLFEPITQMLMEKIFDINQIQETGSLEGAVKNQRYSPDGLAVVKMLCGEFIEDEYIETEEYCTVLFEYKSPYYGIPCGYIPKYYIPQVKTGLCSIPIADFALFVSNMFRKCAFDDLQNTNVYDINFHNRDQKKKFIPELPLAMGIITFHQTQQQYDKFCKDYSDIIDFVDNSDVSDSDTSDSDTSDSDDCSNEENADTVFGNMGNPIIKKPKNNSLHNYIYMNRNTSRKIDFGKSYYTDFDTILLLFSEKLITPEYSEPHVFDKYCKHDFISAQNKLNPNNKTFKEQIQIYKNIISDPKIMGYIPWKLMKSDILYEQRDDSYVLKYEQKINDTIKTIRDINNIGSQDLKIKLFKELFPKSKVLREAGVDNSHIMDCLPKNL
jgi:hypothetical protein